MCLITLLTNNTLPNPLDELEIMTALKMRVNSKVTTASYISVQ
jgi:hypothetical protein